MILHVRAPWGRRRPLATVQLYVPLRLTYVRGRGWARSGPAWPIYIRLGDWRRYAGGGRP